MLCWASLRDLEEKPSEELPLKLISSFEYMSVGLGDLMRCWASLKDLEEKPPEEQLRAKDRARGETLEGDCSDISDLGLRTGLLSGDIEPMLFLEFGLEEDGL